MFGKKINAEQAVTGVEEFLERRTNHNRLKTTCQKNILCLCEKHNPKPLAKRHTAQ